MKKFGIDISCYQPNFDMARAKVEGVEFCIAKCGGADDGLYTDDQFERNYKEAKKNDVSFGAYFFSRAEDEAGARKEAEYCYDHCLKGKQFELPIWYDIENQNQMRIGAERLTNVALAFCEQLASHGFMVGIYSSGSYFERYMDDSKLKDIPHWVAQYYTEFEYNNLNDVGCWQFGGSTNYIRSNKVAGVVCDQDYLFVDYESQIKAAGLNGWGNPQPVDPVVPADKTVDELAHEVLNGEWGNGDEREERLEAAGYDYDAVQDRVNELLAAPEKTVEELAQEVLEDKWGSGDERKERLTEAGYDYDAVQDEVNRILSMKSVHEVAEEVIRGEWGNGDEREEKLEAAGYDYDEVQDEVNKIMNG